MALGFGALGSAALGVDGEDTEAIRFIASVQSNGLSSTPSSDASADLNIEEGDLLVAYIAGDLSSTAFTMEDENGDNQFTVLEKSNVWWAHRAAYVESATANSTATINATATDNNPNGAWGFIVLQFRPHEGRVFQFIGGPAYANLGWGQDPTSDILSSTVTNGVFIGSATSDTQALSGHLLGGVTPDDTFNHSTHNFDVSYSIFDTVQTDIEYFTDTSTSSTRSAGLLAFENTAVDIKTIGTGGDYATPDEWADYIQSFPSFNNHALGRLTDDKIYNTGFSNLDLGDITRNGYTVTLEGYGAGVYDHLTDTGAKLHGGAGSYVMECRYVEVRDIYIRVNASGLNRNAIANGRNTTVKRCVLEAINSGGSTRVAYTGSDSLWESCLIIGGFYGIDSPTIGPSLKNVTFANQNGYGFTCTSHSGAIQNTVAFNSKLGGFNLTGTPTGTYSHNASQDGTHPGTDGVTLTENPFQVGNYIPKQGGQLESAGLHIDEYTDLQNDSYNYIPSIGAYESFTKVPHCTTITLPAIAGNHYNFPVGLLTKEFPREAINGTFDSISTGGGTLRAYTDDTKVTRLPLDVVTFVTGDSPEIEVWVKIPIAYTGATIYIEEDDIETEQPAVTDTYGRNAVWSDYEAVYHLSEDPSGTAPQIIDSTGNGRDLTANGSMNSDNSVVGQLGNGVDFDGSDDYLTYNNVLNGLGSGDFTFQHWLSTSGALSGNEVFLNIGGPWVGRVSGGTPDRYSLYSLDPSVISSVDINDGKLRLFHFTRSGTGLSLYRDGSLDSSGTNSTNINGYLDVSGYDTGSSGFNASGVQDELRIRASALSADWIDTEQGNQSSIYGWTTNDGWHTIGGKPNLPGILIPLPKEFHPGFQNPRIAPSTDVTIDWENPLTKGLGYALKPQKGLIELVSGKSGIPTTTPFNVLGAYEGMKAEYSITGESDNYHNLPKLTEISNSTGVTIFDVMYIESAEDWSTMTVWRALNNDGDERLALEVNSDGDLFCMHNDSWSPSWGVPLPLNKWIVVVGRVNPDATADIFVFDGDSTLSDSTSLTLSLGTMTGARKGASLLDSGTRSVQGGSSLSGMWGRALSDSEIYNFLHNPYQILKPTEDMYAQGIYFTSTAIELPKEYHPNFQNPRVKPNCPVEIDWGNPLTKGLVHRYGGNGYDPHSEYINATQEYGLAGQSTSFALDTQDRIKYPISYGAFREQSFTAKVTFSVSGTGLCYIFNSDLRFNITVGREGVTNGILGISWYDGTFWTIDTIAPVAGRVYTMVVSRLDGVSTELYLYDNDTIRKYSDTTNTGSIVYEPIERGADLGARAFNPFTSGTKVDLYSFEYFNCYKSNTECVQLVQSPYSILKPKEPMVYNFNIRQMPTSGTSKTIMLPDGSVHTYKDRQDQVLHNSVLSNNDVYGGTYTIGTGGDFEEIHDWLSFVKGLGTLYRDQLGILIDDKDYNYGTQDQFDCSSVNLNGHTITMDVEYSVRHRGQFGKGARVEHDPGNQAMWANADQITIKNFSATNTRPDGNYNADVWSYSGRIVFINCMAECYETTTNSTCFDILGSPYHGVAYGCIAKGGFRGFSAANKEMSLFGCIAVDATDRGYNINEHSTRAFMNCVAYNCTTGFSNALVTLTNNSSNNASDDGTEYGANSITLTEYPFQPGTYIPKVGGELDNAGIFTYTEEDLLGYPYE